MEYMDTKVKKNSLCYQVLFNKPLLKTNGEYIYGFRVKVNEMNQKLFSEKILSQYIVEEVFGKCLFRMIHCGSFEGDIDIIWVDREGNEYKGCSVQTRLSCYDATV